MIDIRRDAIGALAAQFITIASAIVLQAILARSLGPEGRGAFAVCLTISAIFGVIFIPGTDRAAQFLFLAKRMSLSEATSGALLFVGLACALGIIAGWIGIQAEFPLFRKANAPELLASLFLLLPATLLSATLELQLAAERHFEWIATFTALQALIALALTALLTQWAELGVVGAVVAYGTAVVCQVIAYGIAMRQLQGFTLVMVPQKSVRELLGYGRRYYMARVGHQLDMNVGPLILGIIGSQSDIGILAATSALAVRILVLPTTAESLLLPRLAASKEGTERSVVQASRFSGMITLLVVLGVALAGPWIIEILLTSEFLLGSKIIWALVPGIIAMGYSSCLMTYFRIIDRPQVCSLAVWVGLSAGVLATLILYPLMGVVGAAIASAVSMMARSAVLFTAFWRVARIAPITFLGIPDQVIRYVGGLLRA